MIEVTCFHCGQVVQISPDAERCSVCGTNLRKLIGSEQASGYFYDRAAGMAGAGNVLGGFQEVQRGLSYVTSSELNLLAAIMCKRLGRLEDMRHYVAAIPVDDALRGEGEWLLRSNQARQRAVPEPQKGNRAPVALPIVTDSDALPVLMDEVTPSRYHPKPVKQRTPLQPLLWVVLLAILAGAGVLVWQYPPTALFGQQSEVQAAGSDSASVAQPEAANPQGLSVATPTPVPTATGMSPDQPLPAEGGLRLPTPTIAPDLVNSPTASIELVSRDKTIVVPSTDLNKLDWAAFLHEKARDDLAGLPVTVRAEGKTLVFEGTTELAEQRAAIEFVARQVPGVADVSVVNVKLRLPATYTVRDGDTLWDISVRVYGNPDQIAALFAANQDQMASASALSVGMELKVPVPQ